MINIKKMTFLMILAAVTIFCHLSSMDAGDNLEIVMQKFKAAQSKLRELRQSGASASEIAAQETQVRTLRAKAAELQSQMGQ